MKQLKNDPLNVVITGVGGQGNVMIALLLGNALTQKGFEVTVGETYGSSQRNGSVMSHMRISAKTQCSPIIPRGCAYMVIGMEPVETLRILGQYGNDGVLTIFNPKPIYSIDVTSGASECPDIDVLTGKIKKLSASTWIIDASAEAAKLGSYLFANMILIGAVIKSGFLPLDEEDIRLMIVQMFPREVKANFTALEVGTKLLTQVH